jgi:hypothetical protein
MRRIHTYLELTVPSRLLRVELLESLEVPDPLVICKEVFVSTSGFGAATPAFVVAPYVVAPFSFFMTLDPIPDPNVCKVSKEQKMPILVEVISLFMDL